MPNLYHKHIPGLDKESKDIFGSWKQFSTCLPTRNAGSCDILSITKD